MKQIDVKLMAHLSGHAMTMTTVLRIRTKDGEVYGLTEHDEDIDYDAAPYTDSEGKEIPGDDFGPLIHKCDNGGFSIKVWEAAADMTVDNSEAEIAVGTSGITAKKLRAGIFDSAEFYVYRLNYMGLSEGHEMVMSGYLDAARVEGARGVHVMRSLTDLLGEPMFDVWSKTCPHAFGSERCPKEFVWVEGTVTSVDAEEPTRIFGSTIDDADDNAYRFGVIEWLTGDNAGKEVEVDQNNDGAFAMCFDTGYSVQIGDVFRVREDCSKVYDDEEHGCLHHWGEANRNLYFGGCPDIPTADGGASMVPGARIKRVR